MKMKKDHIIMAISIGINILMFIAILGFITDAKYLRHQAHLGWAARKQNERIPVLEKEVEDIRNELRAVSEEKNRLEVKIEQALREIHAWQEYAKLILKDKKASRQLLAYALMNAELITPCPPTEVLGDVPKTGNLKICWREIGLSRGILYVVTTK